jgi:hypothetical protein
MRLLLWSGNPNFLYIICCFERNISTHTLQTSTLHCLLPTSVKFMSSECILKKSDCVLLSHLHLSPFVITLTIYLYICLTLITLNGLHWQQQMTRPSIGSVSLMSSTFLLFQNIPPLYCYQTLCSLRPGYLRSLVRNPVDFLNARTWWSWHFNAKSFFCNKLWRTKSLQCLFQGIIILAINVL